MSLKSYMYQQLPGKVRPKIKKAYLTVSPHQLSPLDIERSFITTFFDGEDEYRSYLDELARPPVSEHRKRMMERYERHYDSPRENHRKPIDAGLDDVATSNLYALIRKLKPDTIVETGVHFGHSTTYILASISQNGHGELHSIDPAFDESLPDGTDSPGWIVPEELRGSWNLHVGKSQRVLPELLPELGQIDVFLHDSDHSTPCMLFEFEAAWEWFGNRGVLISDDIHWNDSFSTFAEERGGKVGRVSANTGYVIK